MEKNCDYTANVLTIGSNCEGIIKEKGNVIFVPYSLPQEKVKYKILKIKQNIAFGKVLEVCTPSDDRVRPKCNVYSKCGGCQLQHVKYSTQLKFKTKIVKDCLKKIGGLDFDVSQTVKSDLIYHYRNKLQLPVRLINGENKIGFFAENSHRLIPIDDCPIHPEWAKDLISCLYDFMEKCGVKAYDEETFTGSVRHLIVRDLNGKLIIVLVVNEEINCVEYFSQLIKEKYKDFSLFININQQRNNVITGEKFMCVSGQPRFISTEFGIKYEAGPQTFLQINGNIRKKLYDAATDAVKGSGSVIDAYSGGGLLTAMMARDENQVIGIECVKEAVECADKVAELNKLQSKMKNICGFTEVELPKLLQEKKDVSVVLDPPRKGCDLKVINSLIENKPKQIVYISCNPATLSRDLGLLTGTIKTENGIIIKSDGNGVYELEKVQPYDMFPQTKAVEVLAVLKKKQ